ncbi:hypothetical protein B296_00029247 [Ensete ventricosum]|uniref:Uncharacterized protein n=1 Tax=Ensete ventricosum TaxID=4639 RepID=A0A426Z679_ENSVE|nr:hypothetical protein B296_00029247 [Ensete ventricosum]
MIEQLSYSQMMGQDQAWALGRGSDDAVRLRWEFARRFAKGIEKLAVNTPGDCRKKTKRLTARMLEVVGLVGRRLDHPYPGFRMVANDYQLLNHLGSVGFYLHLKKIGSRR